MPFLDVSDVLLDPMFCGELTIYRRLQQVSNKGRSTTTDTLVDPKPFGVVLPVDAGDLERGSDQQHGPKVLEVHTPYRLRGASTNAPGTEQYQPDRMIWNGNSYICLRVHDLSRYGAGFIQADFASCDPIDVQPA